MLLKKIITGSVLLLVGLSSIFASHHLPIHSPDFEEINVYFQPRLAILQDLGDFDPYLEAQVKFEDDPFDLEYFNFIIGGYYRVHKNLKLGAFYQLEAGALHDDDWVFLNSDWEWQDTSARLEHSLILDATPRILFPGVFKNIGVASMKIRYNYNFFNGHQKILAKPGINLFYVVDRKPVLTAGLFYSLYFPLNFSTSIIYEQGPYVSVLYHLNKHIKLEARGSYLIKTWTEGKDSIELGDSYSVEDKSITLGVGVIIKL